MFLELKIIKKESLNIKKIKRPKRHEKNRMRCQEFLDEVFSCFFFRVGFFVQPLTPNHCLSPSKGTHRNRYCFSDKKLKRLLTNSTVKFITHRQAGWID